MTSAPQQAPLASRFAGPDATYAGLPGAARENGRG